MVLLRCVRALWGFLWGEGSGRQLSARWGGRAPCSTPMSLSWVYQPHTRAAGAALWPSPRAGVSAAVHRSIGASGFLQGGQGAAAPPVTASCHHRPCWGEAPRPLVQAAPARHRASQPLPQSRWWMGHRRVRNRPRQRQAVGSAPSCCFGTPCPAEPSKLTHIPTKITAGRYRLPCPNPVPSPVRTRKSPCCNPAPKMSPLSGEG